MTQRWLQSILALLFSLALITACVAFSEENVPPVGSEAIDAPVEEIDMILGGEVLAPEALPEEVSPEDSEDVSMSAEPKVQPMDAEVSSVMEYMLTANGSTTMNLGAQLQICLDNLEAKSWKSSSKKVASVSKSGLVTALKEGKTKITVTTTAKKKFSLTVKVIDPYKPTRVSIVQGKSMTINVGESLQLNAVLAPETAQSTLTWKSSKPKVASVDGSGLVMPKAEGTAKITVITRNKKKATITIKVVDPYKPTGVIIAQGKSLTMKVGETFQLNASLAPATAQSRLTWKSSKGKIASVDANGLVTAKKTGKAKITVTTRNKKKATITITVVNAPAPTPVPTPEPTPVTQLVGEINKILGQDFKTVNELIPDKFRYYRSNSYTNDYILVETNAAGKIVSVALLTDATSGIGKYTLFGLYPGIQRFVGVGILANYGWLPKNNLVNTNYYYNTSKPNEVVYLTYVNGKIDLILYMKQ